MWQLSKHKSELLTGLYGTLVAVFLYVVFIYHTALINIASAPAFIDELALVLALFFIGFRALRDPIAKQFVVTFLLGMILFTLLSFESLRYRGLVTVLIQNLVHLKFIIIFAFLWLTLADRSERLVKLILYTTIAFLVLNLVTGDLFNQLLNVKPNLRNEAVRPIGIQGDTAGLGITFTFIGLLYLLKNDSNYNASQVVTLVIFIALILLATTRTGLILLPIVALWWMRSSYKLFILMLLSLPVAFFVLKDSSYIRELVEITVLNVQWTVESPEEIGYIRGIMIYYSVVLAWSRFPFGTGAGSYGTLMSDNSPVYTEIGLQNSVYFVTKSGIYDSNLASLLGEFGFLGIALFAFIVYWVFTTPERVSLGRYRMSTGFKLAFFALIAGYSIAVPLFMNSYPALVMCLVAAAAYRRTETVRSEPKVNC